MLRRKNFHLKIQLSSVNQNCVIGQLKGQLTHHACGSEQNASCAHTVVLHFAELIVVVVVVVVVIFYENVQWMSSFFLKF